MDDARRCIVARRTFAATARRKHVLRGLLVGEMAKKEEEKSPHLYEKGHLVKVIVCAQNNVAISFCRMPGVNQLTTSKQTDAIRQYTGLLCNSPTQVAKARYWGLLLLCQGLQSMYVFMVECTFYDTTARPPIRILIPVKPYTFDMAGLRFEFMHE